MKFEDLKLGQNVLSREYLTAPWEVCKVAYVGEDKITIYDGDDMYIDITPQDVEEGVFIKQLDKNYKKDEI